MALGAAFSAAVCSACTHLDAGLESTLNVVSHELKYKADVVRQYGELPTVRCIAGQLNQVFLNLLVNAAQAIDAHGTITVRTGCAGEWVWIDVADTGRGMTPEVQKRVFEPFFTTQTGGQGDRPGPVAGLRHRRQEAWRPPRQRAGQGHDLSRLAAVGGRRR